MAKTKHTYIYRWNKERDCYLIYNIDGKYLRNTEIEADSEAEAEAIIEWLTEEDEDGTQEL